MEVSEMPPFKGDRQFAWFVLPSEQCPTGKFYRSGKPMGSREELHRAVTYHWEHACYQSVYAFDEWVDGRPVDTSARINRIFFDFDAEGEMRRAITDAEKLAGPSTTQWFSGKKGVGMLLHFETVDIHPSLKKEVIKRFSNMIIKNLNLTTADPAVIGDLMRVHRVVNTRHQDTKLYAIPLDVETLRHTTVAGLKERAKDKRDLITHIKLSEDYALAIALVEMNLIRDRMREFMAKDMLSEAFYNEHYWKPVGERHEVVEMLQKLEYEEFKIQVKNTPRTEITNKWLADAEEMLHTYGQLTTGRDRGAEHKARVHFCKYAHECGWTFGQICGAFVNIVDRNGKHCYDKKMTEDQVRSCIGTHR